jgi:hypothetical protein
MANTDYTAALGRSMDRYKIMQNEINSMITGASADVPKEYSDVADVYKTGGEYGKGAIGRIEREAKYGASRGQAALARTGMSSGSLSQGVAARYSRQAREGIQEVEDTRYDRLGGALKDLGTARANRGLNMTEAYKTAATLIGGYRDPTPGEYSDPYKLEKVRQTGETSREKLRIEGTPLSRALSDSGSSPGYVNPYGKAPAFDEAKYQVQQAEIKGTTQPQKSRWERFGF